MGKYKNGTGGRRSLNYKASRGGNTDRHPELTAL